MAKKKQRKTKSQIEYERTRKRVQAFQRRHGYDYVLPVTPKELKGKDAKISANEYKQFTRELNNFYNTLKTGDVVSMADVIVNQFKIKIYDNYPPSVYIDIENWIDKQVAQYGAVDVADMITSSDVTLDIDIYDSDQWDIGVRDYKSKLSRMLKQKGKTQ